MPEVVAAPAVDVPAVDAVKEEVEVDVIVDGPALTKEYSEKKLKLVLKEGGKRGVEIEGAADMGGLQYFCTMIEKPEGDLDLLIESMKAMNAKSDPTEEERKGGAGRLGKMIFSYTEEHFSAVAYVPKDKADACSAYEWLSDMVLNVCDKAAVEDVKTFEGIDSKYYAAWTVKADGEKNRFPIKMRDPSISIAYNYLKARGLFPDADSDDDDEYVFGDEDFP